jgi:N-acyl amino acid synthase of PEP-CTERM/exosortase system
MSWSKKILNTPLIGDVAKKVASVKVSHDAQNIAQHFIQFLQPEVATTTELREEVFRIRHNVYCEELSFEPLRPDGMETDDFDTQSLFALIKHKPTDTYTSCVRLVTSSNTEELLPIEKYCRNSIEHDEFDPALFKRDEICEISRLAVRADFRRRKSDKFAGSATGAISESTYSETELRCFPFIAIGLYMACASLAFKAGKKHAFVMMEPRLARSMKFVGIKFIQLGKPVDYHGLRAPYYINAEIFMDNLTSGFQSLFRVIEAEMARQLELSK